MASIEHCEISTYIRILQKISEKCDEAIQILESFAIVMHVLESSSKFDLKEYIYNYYVCDVLKMRTISQIIDSKQGFIKTLKTFSIPKFRKDLRRLKAFFDNVVDFASELYIHEGEDRYIINNEKLKISLNLSFLFARVRYLMDGHLERVQDIKVENIVLLQKEYFSSQKCVPLGNIIDFIEALCSFEKTRRLYWKNMSHS